MTLDFELADGGELKDIPAEFVTPVTPFGDALVVHGNWLGSIAAVRASLSVGLPFIRRR